MPEEERKKLRRLTALAGDRRGVTVLEYALMTALVAIAIVGALSLTGTAITQVFSTISHTL